MVVFWRDATVVTSASATTYVCASDTNTVVYSIFPRSVYYVGDSIGLFDLLIFHLTTKGISNDSDIGGPVFCKCDDKYSSTPISEHLP